LTPSVWDRALFFTTHRDWCQDFNCKHRVRTGCLGETTLLSLSFFSGCRIRFCFFQSLGAPFVMKSFGESVLGPVLFCFFSAWLFSICKTWSDPFAAPWTLPFRPLVPFFPCAKIPVTHPYFPLLNSFRFPTPTGGHLWVSYLALQYLLGPFFALWSGTND